MENFPSTNPYEIWHATIGPETVRQWLSEENLKTKEKRKFAGFEIVSSLDGKPDPSVEVSLVMLKREGQYPQHVHKTSDAYIIITSGAAVLLSGTTRRHMNTGDTADIPRGTPHGFELSPGQEFHFISVQSPPIKDDHTGEEDFQLVDLV